MRIILDLCGGTGAWSKPYADAGYDVRVITLPEHDVRLYQPPDNVYGILAAPPCTVFAISGARWKRTDEQMIEGLSMMDACIRIIFICRPLFWALENPVGKLPRWIGKYRYTFQPYEYGDPWTKRTCIWGQHNKPRPNPIEPIGQWTGRSDQKGIADHVGEFLPHKILSQKVSDGQINKLIACGYLPENYMEIYGDLKDRQTIRAITPPGFAKAFFEANP